MKQTSFQQTQWAYRFSHGGSLRNQRAGRTARPLSSKEPIHLVFKTNHGLSGAGLRSARRFALAQKLLRKYSTKFHVKVEQVSIQYDHIHLLVRVSRRSLFQNFLRVFAGQIAQQFHAHGLLIKKGTTLGNTETEFREQNVRKRTSKNAEAAFERMKAGSGHEAGKPGCRQEQVEPVRRKKPSEASVTDTPKLRAGLRSVESDAPASVKSVTDTPALQAMRRRTQDESAVKLWKYRPFTRVVRGYKAYQVVRDYIQLNEKEATGEIRYSENRLRGLKAEELARLWG